MTTGAQVVFESSLAGDYNVCVFPEAKSLSEWSLKHYFWSAFHFKGRLTEPGGHLASELYLNASMAKFV